MAEDSTAGAPQGPGDGHQPSPGPGPDAAADAAAVAAYLAEAPPAVREWLLAQAAQQGGAAAGPTTSPARGATPPGRDDRARNDDDAHDDDHDDDLDDDLDGDDDDVIGARLHARARREAPPRDHAAGASGPATSAAPVGRTGRRWARTALVAAVVLGAGFGIWFAGLDNHADEDPGANPSLAAGDPGEDVDTAAYIAELRTTVDADPSDIDARLKLGAALFNDSDLTGAKEQWDAVLDLDPDQAIAWYNLGFFHMSSDPPDWDAVRASWQKVLEIDPTSTMAATVQTHLDGLMSAEP